MSWNRIYPNNVNNELPKDLKSGDAHKQRLYINTMLYGCFEGFYYNGRFRTNYASAIENVTHWMLLPKPPTS